MQPRTLYDKLWDAHVVRQLTDGTTLVYVDPSSFSGAPAEQLDPGVAGQILRLERAGVPVAILRRGDDLASVLGGGQSRAGAAVG